MIKTKILFITKIVTINILVLLITGEVFVRIFNLDFFLLGPHLYYQKAHLKANKVSDNPDLLYELIPGKVITMEEQGWRSLKINKFGFRDKPRKKEKESGIFRIVCLGGSYTYGADVNDNETYPFHLEDILQSQYGKKAEVWNAGNNAYVLSQKVVLARKIVKKYDPDLFILQQYNLGSRAFLYGADFKPLVKKNPDLFLENLKFIPLIKYKIGKRIFLHFRFYRAIVIGMNYFPKFNDETTINDGDHINNIYFKIFSKEYGDDIPILLLPLYSYSPSDRNKNAEYVSGVIDLYSDENIPQKTEQRYFDIHPLGPAYKQHAEIIAKYLLDNEYL